MASNEPLIITTQVQLESLINDAVENAIRKLSLSKIAEEKNEDKLLQIDEVARLLNVSKSTLHTYKKQGTIPFHRIGRRVYFRESEILAALKKIN